GASRRYFDLEPADRSQARWHAERGVVTVSVDHLGTGDSTVPEGGVLLGGPPQGEGEDALSRDRLAASADTAVRAVLADLASGAPALAPVPVPPARGPGPGGPPPASRSPRPPTRRPPGPPRSAPAPPRRAWGCAGAGPTPPARPRRAPCPPPPASTPTWRPR